MVMVLYYLLFIVGHLSKLRWTKDLSSGNRVVFYNSS